MILHKNYFPFSLFVLLMFFSCQTDQNVQKNSTSTSTKVTRSATGGFDRISPDQSGVHFSNLLTEDYNYNIFNFEYLYNGGGIAIGDINNDGLPDLYFTATFATNKLYLNKGNFKFEDITEKAGVAAMVGFKTGVTMADINGDGYLDIYVCRTSKLDDGQKNNHVFINNKDLTFTDRGASLGLSDNMNSNHATFFDYDLDGDLDLYLLNHRPDFTLAVKVDLQQDLQGNVTRKKNPTSPFESDKFYRNNGNGTFSDISKAAGIFNSAFGLSATVSDLNNDGYPDVYVANDYIEPDYVYINNKKGGFVDQYESMIRHSSQNSMGSDIADVNNDGLLDVIVMDMIAEDPIRYKELMNGMQTKRYNTLVKYGYGHQVGRNVLQLNDGRGGFSEVGQLAGISNTDWSWGPLMIDFDNDGWKDIFIANGYRRDVTNLDYMTYTRDSIQQNGGITPKLYPDLNDFMKIIPQQKLTNYCFKNIDGINFENHSDQWGFSEGTFSNGSAYGDLDGDGDLDIVTNNIDDPAFIYENKNQGNYLQVQLKGARKNPIGIGCQVKITTDQGIQLVEQQSSRGFFSSSEPLIHFGLGSAKVEQLEVFWPGGNYQKLEAVKTNQRLIVDFADGKKNAPKEVASKSIFSKTNNGLVFNHKENSFEDFDRERLIPSQLSKLGPHISVGDLNGDGFQDVFVGGAVDQSGSLFLQNKNGTFKAVNQSAFISDKASEDMGSVIFDADGDNDLDLLVVSGGAAMNVGNPAYADRLYLNDGKGLFTKSTNFPVLKSASSQAVAFDYDSDGDQDIFIGGRCVPGSYPITPESFLLKNDGKGNFSDVSKSEGKNICSIGMITSVTASDIDGDEKSELVLAGEWMPVSVFSYANNSFENRTSASGLNDSKGWWNCLSIADIDGDGDQDIIAGNLGKNSRLRASADSPIKLYAYDFDKNEQVDPILSFRHNGKEYPFAGRDAIVGQLPFVKKSYPRYAKYAKATVTEIFGKKALNDAQVFEVNDFASKAFINDGRGKFTAVYLPTEAQVSPIMASTVYNLDGKPGNEIFLSGNFSGADTESGVYDGFNGLVLRYVDGTWEILDHAESGIWIPGEGRSLEIVNRGAKDPMLVATQNDGGVLVFK